MTDDNASPRADPASRRARRPHAFDEAVADFPDEAMNERAPNVEYTPWHIIEHIRLTQADILEYVLGEGYVEKTWPDEYWPPRGGSQRGISGKPRSRASGQTSRRSKRSCATPPETSRRSCPTRRATRSCARCGSSATTTRITSVSSRPFARSWGHGGPVTASRGKDQP